MSTNRPEFDITQEEKDTITATPTDHLITNLYEVREALYSIHEQKKSDPHLSELKNELKDINGDYNARIKITQSKIDFIIDTLNGR